MTCRLKSLQPCWKVMSTDGDKEYTLKVAILPKQLKARLAAVRPDELRLTRHFARVMTHSDHAGS